jgi:hypothetical protein
VTDIIDPETAGRLPTRIRESARRKAEPQRIRKAVEEDMVPDAADGRVRQRQRAGPQRVGKAGQSGKGTGGGVLRGGQHAVDAAKPKGIERAIAAELVVVLLQESEQPPRIVAEHGEEAG